jgi:hypothetical protein
VATSAAAAQRVLVLAGITLLAAVGIFAGRSLAERAGGASLPAEVPAPGGGWYRGVAAATGRAFPGDGPTDCGHVLNTQSLGVAHPVLPCDAKLYLRYGDRTVLTQVLAHGPHVAGHDFELTPALARRLGLRATEPIAWRYSRG